MRRSILAGRPRWTKDSVGALTEAPVRRSLLELGPDLIHEFLDLVVHGGYVCSVCAVIYYQGVETQYSGVRTGVRRKRI